MLTRIIFALVSILLTSMALAAQLGVTVAVSPGSGSDTPFVALHTYYMSPTGSDSNNGLTAATAWASPKHAVNCGDVIIAASGNYKTFGALSYWGTVSNCPSTGGGIDGTGGVYFAVILCGSTLGSCTTNQTTGGVAFDITANNWAVEGWSVNSSGKGRAYEGYACNTASAGPNTMLHHIAFINDISADNLQAADTNDCADNGGSTAVPSPAGVDYFATVGMIAQNSALDPICLGAIDVVGPGVLDTKAGTHYFVSGNFSYANANPACTSLYDTESYMADTWAAHGVTTQGVFSNNIGFDSDRMCIHWTGAATTPTAKIYNNTCFRDNVATGTDNLDGEIHIDGANPITAAITLQNNIAYQPLASSTGKPGHVAALSLAYPASAFTNGGSGTQNVFRANNTQCVGNYCNSTDDIETYGASSTLGTNTYTNPAFTNTTDLLANRLGVPNCSGFVTTTACMGWNANTSALTTPSIISDLVPTASGMTGKGYQLPSTTCAANADFPTWLKGIVYLQWNGSTLAKTAIWLRSPATCRLWTCNPFP